MKRDDEYVRELLFDLESDSHFLLIAVETSSPSPEDAKKSYHAKLLSDAGFLVEVNEGVYRMTNQGHDYLDAIRDNGVWAKTKQVVAETGGSATLEIMKTLATGFLKKKISEHTGIEL